MTRTAVSALAVVLIAALGCTRTPSGEDAASTPPAPVPVTITDRDWELAALGERTDPRGSQGQPVTLRLESESSRAAGFAGCNRYSAGYVLAADSLAFQPAISTKMACADGMEIENTFLMVLPAVTTYEATDSTLALKSSDGALARFRSP